MPEQKQFTADDYIQAAWQALLDGDLQTRDIMTAMAEKKLNEEFNVTERMDH